MRPFLPLRRPTLDQAFLFAKLTDHDMRLLTPTASRHGALRVSEGESDSAGGATFPIRLRLGVCWFRIADFWLVALLLLIVLAGTACRTAARRLVSDPRPAIARLQAGGSLQAEADHLVNPLLANGEVFGMIVGVVTPDGGTHSFGYGQTGRPGDRNPPDINSLFQVGSISKLFTETLLVQLVQEGRLRYDDTVRSLLPTNIPVSVEAGRLTLYELATHTAGLPREPLTLSQLHSFLTYLVTGRNLYANLTVPYLLNYLRDCHPPPKESREFVYSNFGAGLLAYLIEQKTGRPTADLIVERICRPLQMTNSVFTLDPGQQNRLTVGHVGNQACWKSANHLLAPWEMGDLMRPVSGMFSSAGDLLIFAKANLGMLPCPFASALTATHQVQIKTPRGGEALGWIIYTFDPDRRTLTFKDGVLSGYSGYLGLDLDTQVAVVVLANKFNWDEKVGMNLLLRISGAYASGQIRPARRSQAKYPPGAQPTVDVDARKNR
jgi:CubicO group peptidase (beta-lactamase class C family)